MRPEPVERCPHPEFIKPITKNKARNRRPSGRPEFEWCELCWGKVYKDVLA